MVSGAQNLKVTTRNDIYSAVFFPDLIYPYNRRYKIEKMNMHLSNLNYTESSTRFMHLKFLRELSFYLIMLQ
jgi:hypothetical protein